jgi:hypothetical protein
MVVQDRHVLGGVGDRRSGAILIATKRGVECRLAVGRGPAGIDRDDVTLKREAAPNELGGAWSERVEPCVRVRDESGPEGGLRERSRHALPHVLLGEPAFASRERLEEQTLRALLADHARMHGWRDLFERGVLGLARR